METYVKQGEVAQIEVPWPSASFTNKALDIQPSEFLQVFDSNGEQVKTLTPGAGLHFGRPDRDGKADEEGIVCYISIETGDLPVGVYKWQMVVRGGKGEPLRGHGTLEVVPEYTGAKKKTARPWDFLNPKTEYVSAEVEGERLALCRGCENFLPIEVCKKCGCFMPMKVKLAHAECPIGRWKPVAVTVTGN